MSEEKKDGIGGTISGWIKAGITSVLGLVSGAFLMYLTPVVNNVIKPAKPLANFAIQVNGLSANFNNRSTGATQGWWDFGDGTALEPFDPKIDNVAHAYAKAGSYSVKLELQNLLGESTDGTVAVSIDADNVPRPEIETFDVKAITPAEIAPAVYRLLCKVKNAKQCILVVGDSRPMEIIEDMAQERYVTIEEMGAYTFRLAAVNGKQVVEKTQTVYVSPNDGAAPMAKLLVSYQAVKVVNVAKDWNIHCEWDASEKGGTSSFRRERRATPGFKILSAELVNKDDPNSPARNVKLEIAPDRSKVIVSGELTRPTGLLAPRQAAPYWSAKIKAVVESRGAPETINRGDVMMAANIGGLTKLPMQQLEPGYEVISKQMCLQLWDGNRKVWECTGGVNNAMTTLKNQTCYVSTMPQADGVGLKIDCSTMPKNTTPISVAPPSFVPPPMVPMIPQSIVSPSQPETRVGPVIRATSFQRNPLLPKRP